MTSLIGRQIDSYRVEALLGEGGMGAVYRAYDLNLARPVALKVMHSHLARNPRFQQRFMQEARSAARLDHPSIVDIYAFGPGQDLLYMVMAFVPDGSLGAYIKRLQETGQTIQLRETLAILAQVADALAYAHAQGVVHRDIKPDNVLLQRLPQPDREGDPPLRAVVTDFGLAKLLEGGVETATGTVMGTLPYMSPEQCLGDKTIDGRSDIYSLGVMLYQLTTGRLPFDIQSPTDAVMKHLHEVPPPPRAIRPGLPPKVEVIIQKALAKDPKERIQSGSTMAKALRLAAGELTKADVTQFAPSNTVLSMLTRLVDDVAPGEPSRLGSQLTALPGSDQLLIARKDQPARSQPLERDRLVIGRSDECDLVLDGPGVSRRHARLERSPGGWLVVDLGSTNGTFLEQSGLLPDVPEQWDPGRPLRVGPYFLRWRPAAVPEPPLDDRLTEALSPQASRIVSSSGLLGITLNPTHLATAAGQQVESQITITNQGRTVIHVTLLVEDLPAGWLTLTDSPLQLMPGGQAILPLLLQPPAESSATAGRHTFRLVARSISGSPETAVVPGTLQIEPFERFFIDLQPSVLKDGGRCRLQIRNDGNAPAAFRFAGRDPAEAITFAFESNQLTLPPGEAELVGVSVTAKERPNFGRSLERPFEVRVRSSGGQQQNVAGRLSLSPRFPSWVIIVLPFLLTACLVCVATLLITRPGLIFPDDGTDVPPTTSVLAAAQTQTAAVAPLATREAAVAQTADAQATLFALTAEAAGDADGDGLSNEEERALGTDPADADTDEDGLSDGEEVNRYKTEPRDRDTDGDNLEDGREISAGTDPLQRDTDGDGLIDSVDPDPLAAPTATATPTATLEDTATATPSPSPTITPSPTPNPGIGRFQYTFPDDENELLYVAYGPTLGGQSVCAFHNLTLGPNDVGKTLTFFTNDLVIDAPDTFNHAEIITLYLFRSLIGPVDGQVFFDLWNEPNAEEIAGDVPAFGTLEWTVTQPGDYVLCLQSPVNTYFNADVDVMGAVYTVLLSGG